MSRRCSPSSYQMLMLGVPAKIGLKPIELGLFSAVCCDGQCAWFGVKLCGGSVCGASQLLWICCSVLSVVEMNHSAGQLWCLLVCLLSVNE